MRRRYRRRRYGNSDDIGREYARRHIEAARQLSLELGGTDQDVKQYFFSLPPNEMGQLLALYGQKHGAKAQDYAEKTIESWRSGKRHMSGQTMERLFNLMPPRMPLSAKYKLIENLWNHVGPRSRKIIRIGLDANIDDIVGAARSHIEEVVVQYRIPNSLERRFEWLA